MKIKSIMSLSAIATTTVAPLVCTTGTTSVVASLNNAQSNTAWKEIYEIPKVSKWGSSVYQNAWVMNNSSAKRSTDTVASNAFAGNKTLQHVAYSDENGAKTSDIKTIAKGAFQACENLESVWIPGPGASTTTNDTYTIGERAFFRCENLTSLDFTSFGANAENLANIVIGTDAFNGMPETGTLNFDNTGCALFNTEDGTATGTIIEGGEYGEGKTFPTEEVMDNFTTFAEKCIAAGLNKNWFTKYGIKTSVEPKTGDAWNWSNIAEAVEDFEAGNDTIDGVAEKLNYDSAANMIGDTGTVTVNGVDHTVRIIGTNHDELTTQPTGKSGINAAITFEFVNLISDKDGYSLATTWDGDGYTSGINYDYLNSNVFYNLEHLTPATASVSGRTTTYNTYSYGKGNWYQKAGTAPTTDSNYAGKSVYEMLPTTLTDNIKQVQKTVATSSSYTLENYNCKLFLPTATEMNADVNQPSYSSYHKVEGSLYSYYNDSTQSSLRSKSIKKQVSGDTVYTTSAKATGTGGTVYNYAGDNYKADSTGGGNCWLASPGTYSSDCAWNCSYGGSLSYYYVYDGACGVAPCFCI